LTSTNQSEFSMRIMLQFLINLQTFGDRHFQFNGPTLAKKLILKAIIIQSFIIHNYKENGTIIVYDLRKRANILEFSS